MKGWYSVVQFCPDPSRAEAANVGLALLCPDARFFAALMRSDNDRIRRFFKVGGEELDAVNVAKSVMLHRIEQERFTIRTIDDFIRFQKTRGNDLILTDPRSVRVDEPEVNLKLLFDELVGGRSVGQTINRTRGFSARPALVKLFERPEFARLVRERVEVDVPTLHRPLRVPFSFQNGVPNLIAPFIVRRSADETLSNAVQTVIKADLLRRHNVATVIAALPNAPEGAANSLARLTELLDEYELRQVRENDLEAFGREILRVAH